MALVIDTRVGITSFVPYERPPQSVTLWSAIPRGLVSFVSAVSAIALKPINDQLLVQMTGVLPPNFGYVMNDANFSVAVSAVQTWHPDMNLNLQNFYRGGSETIGLSGNWPQGFDTISVLSDLRAMNREQPWPAFPLIGTAGTTGIQFVLSAWNADAAANPAGVLNAYLSFWQFDLEQIRKFPINSPVPVHVR